MKVMFFELSLAALDKLFKWAKENGIEVNSHPAYTGIDVGLYDAAFSIPDGKILMAGIHNEAFGMYINGNEENSVIIKRNDFRKVDMF